MAYADFVHLRVHTAYSLSQGAIPVKTLAGLCRDYRMPAVAVTDTGNLFGAVDVSRSCVEAGVQPIVGCELGLAVEDGPSARDRPQAPDRIVLLAQNETGYRNLIALSSAGFLASDAPEPQVDREALSRKAEGLIALTGGVSVISFREITETQRACADIEGAAASDRMACGARVNLVVAQVTHAAKDD